MARIRSFDSGPERALRAALREINVPFRTYLKLPGRPDICFPETRLAVFVHGCFWHGCPVHYVPPSTHEEFWREKILANHDRDLRTERKLKDMGWTVLTLWECEVEADPLVAARRVVSSRDCLAGPLPRRRPPSQGPVARRSQSG